MADAFDYKAQKWVGGREGSELLLVQVRATLTMLDGPTGTDFAAFSGWSPEQAAVERRKLERTERALVAELAAVGRCQ